MNFFFGQIGPYSAADLNQDLNTWLAATIFNGLDNHLSLHCEDGFSLALISDPKDVCPSQSRKIHVESEFVCACDCILYNKRELTSQLGITPQSSNEQVIITSFKKWGKLFADKFDGKFSFVLWDRFNSKLLGGRDALGYANFCYSQNRHSLYFSSDLATLLDQPQVEKSVNQKRFYQCLRYANNPPQQTYFEHCRYCPPSHIVEFSDVITVMDYWRLNEKKLAQGEPDVTENCKKFTALLADPIEHEHNAATSLGLMLSGGFDSSLLAAVVAGNDSWKQSLTCYSYTFDRHQSCDESQYINQTVNTFNLNSKRINGDGLYVFSDPSRANHCQGHGQSGWLCGVTRIDFQAGQSGLKKPAHSGSILVMTCSAAISTNLPT